MNDEWGPGAGERRRPGGGQDEPEPAGRVRVPSEAGDRVNTTRGVGRWLVRLFFDILAGKVGKVDDSVSFRPECMTAADSPVDEKRAREPATAPDSLAVVFDPALARGERAALRGKIIEYVIVALVVVFLAGYEWLRWAMRTELHPLWMTAFALCIAAYCGARVWWLGARVRALQAGQLLWRSMHVDFSLLGERGYYLFEAVVDRQGVPLGPVLIGPTGVFALTVRTSLPTGRPFEKADHVGRTELRFGGRPAFADPLGGARQAARRLAGHLMQLAGKETSVTPVLVLPGWRMGSKPPVAERDVLVVSETTLAREVLDWPVRIEPKEILRLCDLLKPLS
jgi:hypothetical protein